ncbi:hypothetical protein SISNIDRAFT_489142 [Sistotremastrum niveocremeum HHB9708]|uniref:Uncharacterized protein n=1 Tax=Sistotremastrum niveocremeum HHB9708 TaxID=1314777 RepID=A0A164Q9M4_9AGAM|nr:hypothetical protein SISNIDRAFT_489142 [Sistotremastrum niveocremeum HHB9708]
MSLQVRPHGSRRRKFYPRHSLCSRIRRSHQRNALLSRSPGAATFHPLDLLPIDAGIQQSSLLLGPGGQTALMGASANAIPVVSEQQPLLVGPPQTQSTATASLSTVTAIASQASTSETSTSSIVSTSTVTSSQSPPTTSTVSSSSSPSTSITSSSTTTEPSSSASSSSPTFSTSTALTTSTTLTSSSFATSSISSSTLTSLATSSSSSSSTSTAALLLSTSVISSTSVSLTASPFSMSSSSTVSSSTSTAAASSSTTGNSGHSVAAILGIVFAVIVGLVCLGAFLTWVIRTRRLRASLRDENLSELGFGLTYSEFLSPRNTRKKDDDREGGGNEASEKPVVHFNDILPHTNAFSDDSRYPIAQPLPAHFGLDSTHSTPNAIPGAPLQVANLMPGDVNSSSEMIHRLPVHHLDDCGTPRETTITPRFQGLLNGGNANQGGPLEVPWAPLQIRTSLRQSTRRSARASPGPANWELPYNNPISARSPPPTLELPSNPRTQSQETWATTLRSNLSSALNAVRESLGPAAADHISDDHLTPIPSRRISTKRVPSRRSMVRFPSSHSTCTLSSIPEKANVDQDSPATGGLHIMGLKGLETLVTPQPPSSSSVGSDPPKSTAITPSSTTFLLPKKPASAERPLPKLPRLSFASNAQARRAAPSRVPRRSSSVWSSASWDSQSTGTGIVVKRKASAPRVERADSADSDASSVWHGLTHLRAEMEPYIGASDMKGRRKKSREKEKRKRSVKTKLEGMSNSMSMHSRRRSMRLK